jgi:hypothetical protein
MLRGLLWFSYCSLLFMGELFAQGNSLLWRITGNKLTHASYLYGTMHSSDPRVFHFADSVWASFENCQAFAMEVVIDESVQSSLLTNIFMNGNTSIRSLLTMAQYDSLQRFAIRNASINISDFDRMKPLYVAMMLEMLAGGDSFVNSPDPFLDQFLANAAANQGKEVRGLETAGEQMAVFDAMTYTDQAQLLMKTVREYTSDTPEYERMVQYYLNNDLSQMMEFENDMGIPDSLYEALITQRNIRMARRIDTIIQLNSTFIAVGAGHLGGPGGLVNLLREKKYTVVPVLPSYNNYLKDGWYRFTSRIQRFTADFPMIPTITHDTAADGRKIQTYTSFLKSGNGKTDSFRVVCIPGAFDRIQLNQYLSVTKENFRISEEELTFTCDEKNGNKSQGKIFKGKNITFILENRYRKKPEYSDRFFQSFAILAE